MWSLDFMSDALWGRRRFRTLNVLDEGVREGLAIEVDTSLPAKRVVRVLERLREVRTLRLYCIIEGGSNIKDLGLQAACRSLWVLAPVDMLGKVDQF